MKDQNDQKVEKWLRKVEKTRKSTENRGNGTISYIQYQIVELYNIYIVWSRNVIEAIGNQVHHWAQKPRLILNK